MTSVAAVAIPYGGLVVGDDGEKMAMLPRNGHSARLSRENNGRWKRVGKGAPSCASKCANCRGKWYLIDSRKPSADQPKPTTHRRMSDDQVSLRRRLRFDHGRHRIAGACVRAGRKRSAIGHSALRDVLQRGCAAAF